jgi:hypothetical protein
MKTVHWTWSKTQKKKGKTIEFGKVNALNNFCIGLPGNWPRCTSCHAGYGWKDATFDFSKAESVDCLVCHDTTGTYKKFPTGAGHPAYEGERRNGPRETLAHGGPEERRLQCRPDEPPDLRHCHFYGGGGDQSSTATWTPHCSTAPRSTSTWGARRR